MTSSTAPRFNARRNHTNPTGDEHAAMCWITKGPFTTEEEARDALLDLMLEEIDRDGMKQAVKEIAKGAESALSQGGNICWTVYSY